jgi:hypothetical protein
MLIAWLSRRFLPFLPALGGIILSYGPLFRHRLDRHRQVTRLVIASWGNHGGGDGLNVPSCPRTGHRRAHFSRHGRHLLVVFAVAVAVDPAGSVWAALHQRTRMPPTWSESHDRYKIAAFTLSAFFCGTSERLRPVDRLIDRTDPFPSS